MRYPETKQQSNELLRLIIPLLSKHEAACNPVTFAIWYEYLTGANPSLRQAVDAILAQSKSLTDEQAGKLYSRFILERDEEARDKFQADFMRLVDGVSGAAMNVNEQAESYVTSLGRHETQLRGVEGAGAVANIMNDLLNETLQVRDSVTVLNEELKASLKEVEQLRQELERTQVQALIDPLTGLRNRRGVEKIIEELQENGGPGLSGCCLMMIDIDHFKRINDSHGHLLGDKVIRSVAQVLISVVKGKDTVARWGGEEFLVLLPGTSIEGARALGESIRSVVEKGKIRRMDNSEFIGAVTISLGVASHIGGESFERLVERADSALYDAKKGGRNRVMLAPQVAAPKARAG